MKVTRIITVILFIAIIVAPIITFNFKEDAVSLIDNRNLADNPFSSESLNSGSDLTNNIENYVSDRIGFRDDMILTYTVLNDKLFNKMVHPSYKYGKEGYVFGSGLGNDSYTEYHEAFADMVKQIQDYCDVRNVPFLFVFNPAKPAVLTDYIPDGINYDRTWVDLFLADLDERQVQYIDNTPLLREKTDAGEVVFNQKYDANHWNDLGAYYGTNAILEELNKYISTVHVNSLDELTIGEKLQTSLPVSEFPINEMVPSISIDMDINTDNYEIYANELYRHPSYSGFAYYVNEERMKEGAPKALVFQGSYMNGFGYKYLANAFSECICVHDYQNVIDFSYYFNIFQPECVIFEVAEYTFSDTYFDYNNMCAMDLNPDLQTVVSQAVTQENQILEADTLCVERGEALTTIRWTYADSADYAWLNIEQVYDMKKTENGYEVIILSQVYDKYIDDIQIIVSYGDDITIYNNKKN